MRFGIVHFLYEDGMSGLQYGNSMNKKKRNKNNKKRYNIKQKWKKTWKKSGPECVAALCGVGLLSVLLEMKKELSEFCVRRYTLKVPYETECKEPVKLIFVSDLHGKKYGRENEDLIRAIRNEQPDYILSGGDILTRSEEITDHTAIQFYQKLSKICPVYAANGNHEQRMKENEEYYGSRYARLRQELQRAGVKMLENESCDIDMKGIPVTLSGLEIPLRCYSHFKTVPYDVSEMISQIGNSRKDRFQILLAHNPAYMKQYAQWGSKLTLSGHLHGGIIRIPGIGGLITPQAKLFPKYSGDMYIKDNKACIVSRGLGTHTINIRLMNPAEVVSITLLPKNIEKL